MVRHNFHLCILYNLGIALEHIVFFCGIVIFFRNYQSDCHQFENKVAKNRFRTTFFYILFFPGTTGPSGTTVGVIGAEKMVSVSKNDV